MGLIDRLMGRELPERRDARGIYFRLLEQSRNPDFFGAGKFADDYDGRIDVITLHFAAMMERLNKEGPDGAILRQALFDEMKDDFEIALREQAIGDTGVKKRIKPMIGHFYDGLKQYSDAFETGHPLASVISDRLGESHDPNFAQRTAAYLDRLRDSLKETAFRDIADKRFYFPELDPV